MATLNPAYFPVTERTARTPVQASSATDEAHEAVADATNVVAMTLGALTLTLIAMLLSV